MVLFLDAQERTAYNQMTVVMRGFRGLIRALGRGERAKETPLLPGETFVKCVLR